MIFQDMMGSAAIQSGYTGGKRLAWVASRVELSIARRAAWVAIVADGFRSYLELGGVASKRIFRVRNWAGAYRSTMPPSEARAKLKWPTDAFICLHAGNMGQKQALDNLLDTARLVDGKGIMFVLAGDGNDRARLVDKARNLGLTNLQFTDVQPTGLYESMLEAADVLLLNQRPSVSDMSLPSKLSSYFAAGKPVVAAVAADSEAAREVRLAGGVVTPPGNPSELARAISRLLAEPAERSSLGELARDYFNRCLDQRPALKQYDYLLDAVGDKARRPSALSITPARIPGQDPNLASDARPSGRLGKG
jgi:colanic acid biosynthesis glycosyl transferase WcaI